MTSLSMFTNGIGGSTFDALTFVGALFADQCPIYQSRVFCTRWNGLKKGGLYVDAHDSDEFHNPEAAAPVFRSTEQAFIVVLKNLNYGKVYDNEL